MKINLSSVCLFVALCYLFPIVSFSQFTHKIKADSVRIYNDNCTAELIVENSTSNIKGFLFNKGFGRTEFRKAVIKLNDSSFIIGGDTLTIKPLFNGLLPGSVLFYDGTEINEDNDNFYWDNINKRLGIGTNAPQFRLDMPGYSTTVPQIRIASLEFQSYELNNVWFGNNAYYDGGGFRYRNSGGAGLFYFLGNEGQFRFMPNGVAGTYWSSATGGVDHNGSTQMKITAEGTVALGGSMTYHPGNFTNAGMIVKSDAVLIGTTTDDGLNKLQVNGYARASGFRIPSGTSLQFLKADGTVDNNTYVTPSSLTGYLPLTGGTLTGVLNGTSGAFSGNISTSQNMVLTGDAKTVSTTYAGVTTSNFYTNAEGGNISVDGSNSINFRSGGVSGKQNMVITGTGNVGIGTTSPTSYGSDWTTLGINGSSTGAQIDFMSGGTKYGFIASATHIMEVGSVAAIPLRFVSNGIERGRLTSAGRWLFGTTTDDGSNLGQFNGNVSISNPATFGQLKVSGTNTGYTQAHVLLQSSTLYTPEARGLGLYTFNEGLDVNWYVGNFYNGASVFGIGRRTGISFDVSTADVSNSLWHIAADGIMTYKAVQGSGNRIIATNNSGEIIALTVGSGLSLSGSTLSATAGSSVTGAGTAAHIPLWNSANDIGNSVMTQSSGTLYTTGAFNADGQGRFKGWYTNGTGAAVEIGMSSGNGNVIAYNRTVGSYTDLYFGGANINVQAQGGTLNFTGASTFSSTVAASSFYSTTQNSIVGSTSGTFKALAISNTGITGNGIGSAIYMGYVANGGDPYGVRIAQTGYPGYTRRGGFRFQSHGDASGDGDSYYYDLLTLSTAGDGSFTGNVTATSFNGAGTGLTGTASSLTSGFSKVLSIQGSYVWSASATPSVYYSGITSSFVRGEDGWPSYGSVMNMQTYSVGGGSLQMYIPYSPSFGGTGMQVRFGNYDVAGGDSWTSWKTLLASDNFNSYAMAGAGYSANQNLNTTSNVTFNQGTFTNGAFDSDERLKDIINRQVKTSISDKVNVMSYTWKDRNKGEGVQYGYSAQELKKLIPEAVVVTQNNTYAVNYNMVHSVLIDENTRRIQNLEKTIEELKETIEKLKEK